MEMTLIRERNKIILKSEGSSYNDAWPLADALKEHNTELIKKGEAGKNIKNLLKYNYEAGCFEIWFRKANKHDLNALIKFMTVFYKKI